MKHIIIIVSGFCKLPLIPSTILLNESKLTEQPKKKLKPLQYEMLESKALLEHDNVHPFSKFIGKKKY